MRLYCKLAVVIAIGLGLHVLIQRHEGELDEAGFAMRVFSLYLRTGHTDHPELMDAALALEVRQTERFMRRAATKRRPAPVYSAATAASHATTRPAGGRDASMGDDPHGKQIRRVHEEMPQALSSPAAASSVSLETLRAASMAALLSASGATHTLMLPDRSSAKLTSTV